MFKRRILAALAALALAGGISAVTGTAYASTPHLFSLTSHVQAIAYRATTSLTNRPDSGNGGDWATDTIGRTLTITVTGTPGHYTDTAVVGDTGTFVLIPGALAPNQSAPGVRISSRPSVLFTSISGTAHYVFTSDSLPSPAPNMGVPASEDGAPVTPGQSTSSWYLQAFPSSAVVSPGGITTWGWTYTAYVNSHGALRIEQWADLSNGNGNRLQDGNITA